VILGFLLLLALVSVPLASGSLDKLTTVRLRFVRPVVAAFVVQILIVNVFPHGAPALHVAAHVATYVVILAAVGANLGLPGIPVLALGGLSNALAIWANGGVMPASDAALRTAGLTPDPEGFTNSGMVHEPRLAFLGDIFATPASVPAANVFSVGDVLLVLGAFVFLHVASESRLGRRMKAIRLRPRVLARG
jgi:Family of unknown function (DUF5317)